MRSIKEHGSTSEQSAWLLIDTIHNLSTARTLADVTKVVRNAARRLVAADGATFVLEENGHCYYADEEAISPLFKGGRYPLDSCVSGWVMKNKQQTVIEDIYADERIPHEVYRPTFVKSLVMTPVRRDAPIAAIGTYWAKPFRATFEQTQLLQALADTTAVAIDNVQLYAELEQRVRVRTSELEALNRELEAFARTVCHDLKSPLRSMVQLTDLMSTDDKASVTDLQKTMDLIGREAARMADMTDALMKLSRISFAELDFKEVNVSKLVRQACTRLAQSQPERRVEIIIAPNVTVHGDEALLASLIDNLVSNAWKYSSKTDNARIEFGKNTSTGEFFIKDNGTGFNTKGQDRLFQPFQRFHRPEDFEGTGVGLATCLRIMIRHSGQIRVESEPGQGTTFFVSLPTPKCGA